MFLHQQLTSEQDAELHITRDLTNTTNELPRDLILLVWFGLHHNLINITLSVCKQYFRSNVTVWQ